MTRPEDSFASAQALITPELIVYPVRHHSPACAWHLQQLIAERPPSLLLVEGPRSFTPLAALLARADAKMPLAVYAYAVERTAAGEPERRHAAYYPFCDYSPELVALRAAAALGVPARFIDLDYAEQCGFGATSPDQDAPLLDERHYRRSARLQAMAEQQGCRDHEELWEHLFEIPSVSLTPVEHIERVVAYCRLSRADADAAELARDGSTAREAEMAFHIRAALAERAPDAGPVLAVVGGFHALVLPGLVHSGGARPTLARRAVAEQDAALIRYSFERLDRLNGYAAGMTSPAWHQRLWEQLLRHDRAGLAGSSRVRRETALAVLAEVAAELREKHDVALPMPAFAAAYEQCLRLAALRRRPAPAREDLLDAITSCFVKGDTDADGAVVAAVAARALRGTALGAVPAGAPTPPLVRDFAWRARRQRLKIDDSEPRRASLDLYRRPAHRLTSRLLHGLVLLGVPFGVRTAGPDFVRRIGLERLQEHWEYTYSAATEAALVEASVYGATVPLAVANRFALRIAALATERSARLASERMAEACVLGLHDHLPRLVEELQRTIAAEAAFDSVSAAAATLGVLQESSEPLEAGAIAELPSLLAAAYQRSIYLGRELRGQQCDPSTVIRALTELRELLASRAGQGLDAGLYWAMIEDLAGDHDLALVRGAAVGLLYAAGRRDDDTLGAAVDGHLRGLAQPADAVAFLRGLLATAREAAWQQPRLLEVLDGLFGEWSEEAFVANLPELRLAFAAMTPKETDRIADAVAALHGDEHLGPLVHDDVDAAAVQAQLELSQRVAAILTGDGLGAWLPA